MWVLISLIVGMFIGFILGGLFLGAYILTKIRAGEIEDYYYLKKVTEDKGE